MTERRSFRPEIRVADPDSRMFEAVVLRYNVIDDYDTRFRPGVFAESLEERLPRIVWAHQWSEPLGRYVDYRDTDTELTLVGEFDEFDAVPRARQAYAQLRSGTIDQFSVGFSRLADEHVDPDDVDGLTGVVDITKGVLEEASLVLVGAVPGTKLLAVRSGGEVPESTVFDMARQVAAGSLTHDEAAAAIRLIADAPPPTPPTPAEPDPAVEALEVDADHILSTFGGES